MEEYKGLKVPGVEGISLTDISKQGGCGSYDEDGNNSGEDRGGIKIRHLYEVSCVTITRCRSCLLHVSNLDTLRQYLSEREKGERVAVTCTTEDEWDAVREKGRREGYRVNDGSHHSWDNRCSPEENYCIDFDKETMRTGYSPEGDYRYGSYTIISAEEYLGDGTKSKIIDYGANGSTLNVSGTFTWYIIDDTEEDTMNTNIAEVYEGNTAKEEKLVQKHMADQVGTGFLMKRLLIDKKEEVLAEAVRLEEEEEKDGK